MFFVRPDNINQHSFQFTTVAGNGKAPVMKLAGAESPLAIETADGSISIPVPQQFTHNPRVNPPQSTVNTQQQGRPIVKTDSKCKQWC